MDAMVLTHMAMYLLALQPNQWLLLLWVQKGFYFQVEVLCWHYTKIAICDRCDSCDSSDSNEIRDSSESSDSSDSSDKKHL